MVMTKRWILPKKSTTTTTTSVQPQPLSLLCLIPSIGTPSVSLSAQICRPIDHFNPTPPPPRSVPPPSLFFPHFAMGPLMLRAGSYFSARQGRRPLPYN
ncbi:hypothetical protein Sjap_011148 [Stephania japonica]|uniref:Uncharacterized protein n=1 Tax=Stephania japonica TaxID=461633 RepID=A0AAP0P7U2_9MAGN